MPDAIITVEGLSKRYRLGQIGAGTLNESLQQAWRRWRGRTVESFADRDRRAARGLAADANEIWALKDVSFSVRHGEVVGVIGRNGAGKSTLLKILTRITEPTEGRALLRGRVSSLLEVGTGFHPELTGRENTYLNGAILGMKKREIDRKFDEIVAFAEIEKFIDTPVKRYSSGMYVRLAFAVAAHLEPEILLVDEVLAVGDLAFQKKCLGKMETVARAGRTVLFVSHNMAAITGLCQRAILLQEGRLEHDGPAADTVAAYVASVQKLMDEQPLQEREDRQGGERFRFQSVLFRDAATLAPLNILVSGQPVLIDLGYLCRAREPLSDVVVAVSFEASSGAFLSACRSDAIGKSFRIAPGAGRLWCRLPKLPFSQGRFNYNVIAYQQGDIIDWVKEAGYVDVVAGDYYGTGKIPAPALQSVCIDFDWELPEA
jgi:lipopolysaccharide transport system ATP-binding protein